MYACADLSFHDGRAKCLIFSATVNEILGDHNVDKQMSDSRGDVAYLMADINDVNIREIKEIYETLEELSCMC